MSTHHTILAGLARLMCHAGDELVAAHQEVFTAVVMVDTSPQLC